MLNEINSMLGLRGPIQNKLIFNVPNIMAKIEYVDYVTARSISKVIEDWADALDKPNINIKFYALRQISHKMWLFFTFVLTISSLIPCYYLAKLMLNDSGSFYSLSLFAILSTGIVVTFRMVGRLLGDRIEVEIDKYAHPKVLRLNKGDTREVEAKRIANKSAIRNSIKVLIALVVAIAANVFSYPLLKYLYSLN